jgi:alkylation response protein AidB-like acyl-CoA dehydrogenase
MLPPGAARGAALGNGGRSMDGGAISESMAALAPQVRARAAEIEAARRLPADLAETLRATGLFALSVPRAIGGREGSPSELMDAIEAVAAADGSTGWCAMVGIGNNVAAGYMAEEGAREVFADPTLPTAGIAAPAGAATRVEGGARVSGRWAFASGIDNCAWAWAGCLVMEDGAPRITERGPEMIHVCMPVSELTLHDTWHVSGLCGTGSHDFSAADVFVPERRIFRLLDPSGHRAEPLYRMPPLGLFVYQLASVGLGIARAALDELEELARSKPPSLYQEPMAARAATQVEVARAEAALGAARAFLRAAVDDVWKAVQGGGDPTDRQIALARAACTQAAETAAAVTRTASTLGGGSAIYTASRLQRHMRDAEAITHHFTVAPFTWEQAGRVLLGRDPGVPVI